METQLVEVLGRNHLTDELIRAGLEVSRPVRDRGIDLVAYADRVANVPVFVARPIQLKAASARSFCLDKKYERYVNLLIAYVWNLAREDATVTYAMTYKEALGVAHQMGYARTPSWNHKGKYVTNSPGVELQGLLKQYRMTPERWWDRITQGT